MTVSPSWKKNSPYWGDEASEEDHGHDDHDHGDHDDHDHDEHGDDHDH